MEPALSGMPLRLLDLVVGKKDLCNEPLKGYPRIKKTQKIGPDHK